MSLPAVLDSFADAVDETYDPENDGVEDVIDPHEQATLLSPFTTPFSPLLTIFGKSPTLSIVVPYKQVGEGDKNRDAVFAIKRAYARSVGYYRLKKLMAGKTAADDLRRRTWSPAFSDEFGQRNYTRARHTLLAPYFDAYAISLLRSDDPPPSPRERQIALQLGWHTALYNRRMSVIYSQLRPSQLGPAVLITRGDCSGSVAGGCKWASILPAVDWRYTNTRSQINLGQPVAGVAAAKVGDVFLYGSPSHEALYLGGGLVWSFGSYPMRILRHDYRHDRAAIRRFVP